MGYDLCEFSSPDFDLYYFITCLHVREVTHDYAVAVSEYISEDLQLLNSYDIWHGNENRK